MMKIKQLYLLAAWFMLGLLEVRAAEPDAAGVEFFEKKIRPLLVDHCYSCHSQGAEKGIKGGLALDSKEGVLKGGDTGPALVPGDPEKSLLIKAVRYADENLQMPPKNKKLSATQVADLEAWVKMGAPDPRTGAQAKKPNAAATHWAFQPVKNPAIPKVKNQRWVQNSIDAFVLAKLESKNMAPSRQADKRTLIRRATFDLIGLPPTPAEVDDFLNDKSSEAFAKVVDRLLSSPLYGERWGRHWLDIARYADTKGYLAGNEERRFPYSYTYRDYVIRSFNEDLPYNQFLVEQIAADRLELGNDKRALAALGFLTLGRRFLNNPFDIADDRIDVVTRGTMGLTVSCARCHDHKYDPIPTKDYYSLFGVFNNSSEPPEKPLLGIDAPEKAQQEYLKEKKKREDERDTFILNKENEMAKKLRVEAGKYLLMAVEHFRSPDKSKLEENARARNLDPGVTRKWLALLERSRTQHDPVFSPLGALLDIPDDQFAAKAPQVLAAFGGNPAKFINPSISQAILSSPAASLKQVVEKYEAILKEVEAEWESKLKADANLKAIPDANREALRQILFAESGPAFLPRGGELQRIFDVPSIERTRELRRRVEELDAVHPGAPPRAMALVDNPNPRDAHVLVRGNPGNIGPKVPRQFLEVLSGPERKPFSNGSGRLELARAIASPENPLTARVMVNRVWVNHFGMGLVRTPSDFGVRSDPPSHPELLDWLSIQFVQNNWSLKKLHRLMMLSSTYQQASDDKADHVKKDPMNLLLWKMNRRRVEFESLRDSLLFVSGKLDLTPGGQSVEISTAPFSTRRTVYGYIDRQNLPPMFRTFDFASPDTSSSQRFFTTVPQQALFMMNNPFVLQQADALVERKEVREAAGLDEKILQLYRLIYQRVPSQEEKNMARKFVVGGITPEEIQAWKYGYGSVEDPAKVRDFQPFPDFGDNQWRAASKLPDPKIGWATLSPEGGHPGKSARFAAVRRWVAPRDGDLEIEAKLRHKQKEGDGVTGYIISSRSGKLGEWKASYQDVDTNLKKVSVRKGETIDFAVTCNKDEGFDSFTWTPALKLSVDPKLAAIARTEWRADKDFAGKNAQPEGEKGRWQKLAQVLLLSNEFVFVD